MEGGEGLGVDSREKIIERKAKEIGKVREKTRERDRRAEGWVEEMGKKGDVQEVSEGGREGERGTVRVRNWAEKRERSLSEDGAVG